MLDARDLELLRNLMNEALVPINQKFDKVDQRFEKIDQRFEEIDQRFEALEKTIDIKIHESENAVLRELDRVQVKLNERMDDMQKQLDEVKQECRRNKLENENFAMLFKSVENLSKRVDVLEEKNDSLSKDFELFKRMEYGVV